MRSLHFKLIFAAGCIFAFAPTARADFDIWPHVDSSQNRIITNGTDDNAPQLGTPPLRVFTYGFDSNPTNDPGFNAFDGSFPFPSEISVNVLTNLQFWNGSGSVSFGAVPAGESINLANDLTGSNFTVGANTGFQSGFLISAVDAAGGAHKHLFSTLQGDGQPGPASGVYMIEMRVRLLNSAANQTPYPGVADSLPIFLLYNNGVADSIMDTADDWVTINLVPFGDFNRDQNTTADDIPAMLAALTDLQPYKTNHQLTQEELVGFADINGDGKVDNVDIQAMLDYTASTGGGGAQAVPEPASLSLLLAAVLSMLVGQTQQRSRRIAPRVIAGG
jgi:hypothetical protein